MGNNPLLGCQVENVRGRQTHFIADFIEVPRYFIQALQIVHYLGDFALLRLQGLHLPFPLPAYCLSAAVAQGIIKKVDGCSDGDQKKWYPEEIPRLFYVMIDNAKYGLHDDASMIVDAPEKGAAKTNNCQPAFNFHKFHRRPLGRIFDVVSESLTQSAADVNKKNNCLTNCEKSAYRAGTINLSGSSAPVISGFFVPSVEVKSLMRRVDRAEYKTREGNEPSRLRSVVETRQLTNLAKPLISQEAQNE